MGEPYLVRNSMNYNYIRLTEDLTVPANAVFQDHDTPVESHVLVSVPVYNDAGTHGSLIPVVSIQGEAAFALRAFLRGEITFPIIGNGILDIPGGWMARRAAQELGGGLLGAVGKGLGTADMALATASDDGTRVEFASVVPEVANPSTEVPASTGIDFSRVLKRIQEGQVK